MRIGLILLVCVMGMACVSKKKFTELQSASTQTEQSLRDELKQTLVENSRFKQQYEDTRD